MTYRDYEIYQNGQDLSCSDKIVINKYDNKTSRLHFNFEENMEGNYYIALQNPTLNKYFIDPIVDGYYEFTSAVSVYPGRWKMVLIVTDLAYEITDDTFDQSVALYVSNEYPKIIVKDNFLIEEDKDAIDPIQSAAIDDALYRLELARNTLTTMAQNAADSAESASLSEINSRSYNTNISNMYNRIVEMYNEIVRIYNNRT